MDLLQAILPVILFYLFEASMVFYLYGKVVGYKFGKEDRPSHLTCRLVILICLLMFTASVLFKLWYN